MSHFDITKLENNLKNLESQTLEENFWNDNKKSSKVLSQIKHLKSKVLEYKRLNKMEESELCYSVLQPRIKKSRKII